jgi:hypothetical protein
MYVNSNSCVTLFTNAPNIYCSIGLHKPMKKCFDVFITYFS